MTIRYAIALALLSFALTGCHEDLLTGGFLPGLAPIPPAANVYTQPQTQTQTADQLINDGQHGAPGSGLLLRPGHPTI